MIENVEEYLGAFIVLIVAILILGSLVLMMSVMVKHWNDPKPIRRYIVTTTLTNYIAKQYVNGSGQTATIWLEDGRSVEISGTYSIEQKIIGYEGGRQ